MDNSLMTTCRNLIPYNCIKFKWKPSFLDAATCSREAWFLAKPGVPQSTKNQRASAPFSRGATLHKARLFVSGLLVLVFTSFCLLFSLLLAGFAPLRGIHLTDAAVTSRKELLSKGRWARYFSHWSLEPDRQSGCQYSPSFLQGEWRGKRRDEKEKIHLPSG